MYFPCVLWIKYWDETKENCIELKLSSDRNGRVSSESLFRQVDPEIISELQQRKFVEFGDWDWGDMKDKDKLCITELGEKAFSTLNEARIESLRSQLVLSKYSREGVKYRHCGEDLVSNSDHELNGRRYSEFKSYDYPDEILTILELPDGLFSIKRLERK